MVIFRRGVTFSSGDQVTNTKLHKLFDDATVTDITNSELTSLVSLPDSKLANITTVSKVNLTALSLMSQAAGDILWSSDGSTFTRLPIGTAGQTLKAAWDSYTKAVSTFDGSDEATAYTDPIAGAYTFEGTAQLDTSQKKFGTASLLLDGDSDYVTLPDSADWTFGTGDFTIDMWVRFSSVVDASLYSQYKDASNRFYLLYSSGGLYFFYRDGATTKVDASCAFAPVADTWYHIAVSRASGVGYMFINGVSKTISLVAGAWTNSLDDIAAVIRIGSLEGTDKFLNGWIDEFRVSKGIARWTADFTVPQYAYTPSLAWTTP